MKGGVSRGIEEGGNAYPRNELVAPSFTQIKAPVLELARSTPP